MSESRYMPDEREAAADLMSACACECAEHPTDKFVYMAPIEDQLFNGEIGVETRQMAIELAGSAFNHVCLEYLDFEMTLAEQYAEAEALIREGWEPSDDEGWEPSDE